MHCTQSHPFSNGKSLLMDENCQECLGENKKSIPRLKGWMGRSWIWIIERKLIISNLGHIPDLVVFSYIPSIYTEHFNQSHNRNRQSWIYKKITKLILHFYCLILSFFQIQHCLTVKTKVYKLFYCFFGLMSIEKYLPFLVKLWYCRTKWWEGFGLWLYTTVTQRWHFGEERDSEERRRRDKTEED